MDRKQMNIIAFHATRLTVNKLTTLGNSLVAK